MRVAFLNWRDSGHPDGGGAEHYAEQICEGLAGLGYDVTLYCAAYPGAEHRERVGGYRVSRQGNRLTVYGASVRALREDQRVEGDFDVVVDVQNGLPFFAPLGVEAPVVNLTHHVHEEQWPVVFGPIVARLGWWIESVLAPKVYRGRQYVAVSDTTRDELSELGVNREHIAVIHNGTDTPKALDVPKAETPTIVVLGRLVPHKRVEHAIDVVARLRDQFPGLRLRIIGDGWWRDEISAYATRMGQEDIVDVLGFVSDEAKHAELASAWVALAPSIKEGWGLCVVEAASHFVPTVAYHGTGGLEDSIQDGRTGRLVGSLDEMTSVVADLLTSADERARLGRAAREYSRQFEWEGTVAAWDRLLRHVATENRPTAQADEATFDQQ